MLKTLSLQLINFYQQYLSFDSGILRFLTPGGVCKYEISCSEYTKQQIFKYGALKGIFLGAKRIISCR